MFLLRRAFANIDMATYSRLNPLALCGSLKPFPGTVVCVGDKMASCSNVHRGAAGETCQSIQFKFGSIVGGNVRCSGVVPDAPICVRPAPNKVPVFKLKRGCVRSSHMPVLVSHLIALSPDSMLPCRPAQCDVDSLCGVPLSDDMRDLLSLTPDWCSVLQECKVNLRVSWS